MPFSRHLAVCSDALLEKAPTLHALLEHLAEATRRLIFEPFRDMSWSKQVLRCMLRSSHVSVQAFSVQPVREAQRSKLRGPI